MIDMNITVYVSRTVYLPIIYNQETLSRKRLRTLKRHMVNQKQKLTNLKEIQNGIIRCRRKGRIDVKELKERGFSCIQLGEAFGSTHKRLPILPS